MLLNNKHIIVNDILSYGVKNTNNYITVPLLTTVFLGIITIPSLMQ